MAIPTWMTSAQQAQMAQHAYNQGANQYGVSIQAPLDRETAFYWRDINTLEVESPVRIRIQDAVYNVIRALPYGILVKIIRVSGHVKAADAVIYIKFHGGHTLSFPYTDAFPAAEDIARIALECP